MFVTLFLTVALALEAQEQDLERLMTRGKVELDLGRTAAAATTFEQVARDPAVPDELHWEALVRLGQARARLGEHASSVAAFREVITTHRNDPDAVRFLTLAVAGVAPGPSAWKTLWREVTLEVVDAPHPRPVVRWPGFTSETEPLESAGGERLSLHVESASLATVVRELGDEVGVSWLIYPGLTGEVTASLENVPRRSAFDLVVRAAGATLIEDDDGVLVVADASGAERLRRARRVSSSGAPVSLDLDDSDLLDLFRFLADVTGNNFVVLPGVSGRVELAMTERPWDAILFHAVTANGLSYSVRDNVVVVGAPDAMADYVALENEDYRGERISLGFTEVGIEEVRHFFESVSGLPVVTNESLPGSFTFKLTDVRWDHALDLVAALNQLKAEVDGSTIRLESR